MLVEKDQFLVKNNGNIVLKSDKMNKGDRFLFFNNIEPDLLYRLFKSISP